MGSYVYTEKFSWKLKKMSSNYFRIFRNTFSLSHAHNLIRIILELFKLRKEKNLVFQIYFIMRDFIASVGKEGNELKVTNRIIERKVFDFKEIYQAYKSLMELLKRKLIRRLLIYSWILIRKANYKVSTNRCNVSRRRKPKKKKAR